LTPKNINLGKMALSKKKIQKPIYQNDFEEKTQKILWKSNQKASFCKKIKQNSVDLSTIYKSIRNTWGIYKRN
jgi:hypothetical protein